MPLALSIAKRMRTRFPRHVDFEDIIALAYLGLVQAAKKFEPERGFAFATFATHRIRGSILDHLTGKAYPVRMEGLDLISDEDWDYNKRSAKTVRMMQWFHCIDSGEERAITSQRERTGREVIERISNLLAAQDKTLVTIFSMRMKGNSYKEIGRHFGHSQAWGYARICKMRSIIGEHFGHSVSRSI